MGHDKRGRTRSITGPWLIILALILFVSPAMNIGEAMAEMETMVIAETTEDNFTSDVGVVFMITDQTVVLDPNGAVSDLRYIRLPCRADVDYEASDSGTPVASTVTVIETLRKKQDRPDLPE